MGIVKAIADCLAQTTILTDDPGFHDVVVVGRTVAGCVASVAGAWELLFTVTPSTTCCSPPPLDCIADMHTKTLTQCREPSSETGVKDRRSS